MEEGKLITPEEKFGLSVDVINSFINGFYHYIEGSTPATQKQIIRGLRALLELPFIQIQNPEIIKSQLEDLDYSLLDGDAKTQIEKMKRNAYAGGAGNRTYLEPDSLLSGLAKNRLIPIFATQKPITANREDTGKHSDIVDSALMDIDEFQKNCCVKDGDDYVLYHGTKDSQAMLGIIRGGFISSVGSVGQGVSVYGSGLYTTNNISFAKEYGNFLFNLKVKDDFNIRVFDIKKITPAQERRLDKEVKEGKYIDINDLLKCKYNIDIVYNTHFVVQNANVFKQMSIEDTLLGLKNSIIDSSEKLSEDINVNDI